MSQEEANKNFKDALLSISNEILCAQYVYGDEEKETLKILHSRGELESFINKLVHDSWTGYGLSKGIIHLKNGDWADLVPDWCEVNDILYTDVCIRKKPSIPVECME